MDRFLFGPLGVGLALFLALILGVGSALWMIGRVFSSPIRNGPWQYNPLIGSQAAGAYLRATIARIGLLALSKAEAIYLIANRDSDGRPLSGDASYRVEGVDVASRWWSITAYGADSFLIPNSLERYSYSSRSVQRSPDGSYCIQVASTEKSHNWLPVQPGQPFDLMIRLYNPSPSVLENLGEIPLPRIIRETSSHA